MTSGNKAALKTGSRIIFCLLVFFWCASGAFAFSRSPLLPSSAPSEDAGGKDHFSFVVFGDCHVGSDAAGDDRVFKKLVKRLAGETDADFAVNLGDFAHHGRKAAYDKYFKEMSRLKAMVYHVPGNHDLAGDGYKRYLGRFKDYYYSYDHKNAHFIILNNAYGHSFDAEQFAWLKQDLAGTDKEHVLVFMHRPVFDPGEIFSGYVMSGRQVTRELLRLFDKYGVDYVFAGHIHGYASSKRDGTFYVVSGGGGGPLHLPRDFGGYHHYVKIRVEDDRILERVVKIDE